MINANRLLHTKARMVSLILLLVSAFFTTMYGYSVYQQAQKVALNDTAFFVQATKRDLQQFIDKYISDVRMLSNSPLITDIAEGEAFFSDDANDGVNYNRLSQIFKAYMGSNDQVVQARLISIVEGGLEKVRVNRIDGSLVNVETDLLQSKSHRDYYQSLVNLKKGQVFVSDINLNRDFGALTSPFQPVVRIGVPVFKKSGQLFAVVLLNVGVSDRLQQIIESVKANSQTAYILLLNEAGDYVTHPVTTKNFGFEFGAEHTFAKDFNQLSDYQLASKTGHFHDSEATRFFFTRESLALGSSDRSVEIVAILAVSPVIWSTLMSAIYLEVLLLVVIVAFMIYLNYSSRNIELEKQQAALKAELEFDIIFREMIDTAPYAKILLDERGNIEMVNREAEQIFGYQRSELMNKNIELIVPAENEEEEASEQGSTYPINVLYQLGSHRNSSKAIRKDGTEFPVEVSLTALDSHQGKKIQVTILDVSEREKFITELSRQNSELNQFAYVASHDLKAPLRGIDQIASWLEEDLANTVNADSKKHLKLMRSRINRMESLLAGLLQYARAGSVLGDIERIDLQQLVIEDFQMINSTQRFELKIKTKLPTLTTSKPLIDIVFRNLISNAMKHHDRTKGVISIDYKQVGSFYQFEVCDDGPGIPEEFRGRVFGLFQTLKPRDEVEGSGMGLSIVKKTIETIGGQVEIGECEPCGARITFTWPVEIEPEKEEPIA